MKRAHFEALRPVCPTCAGSGARRLELSGVEREEADAVLEGSLLCTNAACQREYPILDGLPLLLPNLRAHVADNAFAILARDDLGAANESRLNDCCGPGSPFDTQRQHLSNYAWDHYGEFDPEERESGAGSIARVLQTCLEAALPLVDGPLLELGCSVGRGSFELAGRTGRTVLGADLHHAKLRLAARVLREQRVVYPRRRVGIAYDRRAFPVRFAGAAALDFWCCDGAALPFEPGTFAAVVALNVLDCTRSPLELLGTCARVLRPGGKLILACPYDWSTSATPLEAWIGGHSQRGPQAGASEPLLRALLTPGAHPQSVAGMRISAELDGLEWTVRLHERSRVAYRLHALVATASS